MESQRLAQETFCHVAIVVDDIERAAKAWAEALGVPVPQGQLTDPAEKAHTRYRGQPTDGRAKLAFFQLGPVTIELIEPVGGPSVWQERLDAAGPGVHHVAFQVRDADATVERLKGQGMDVVQTGEFTGGRYIYLDAAERLGVLLELLANRR